MPRILVVDDDPDIALMLSEVLRGAGHEVAAATHSPRAFGLARRFRPDLVLMDLLMPEFDGLEQIRLLSLDQDLRDVPVIMMTGSGRGIPSGARPMGHRIVAYLYKPFEPRDLLEQIDGALGGRVVS